MANQKEEETKEYLENHKVLQLIDNMTAMLVFHQPKNPRKFLIENLEKLKIARQSGFHFPTLISDDNLAAIFDILDPIKRGFITRDQYTSALQTIGVEKFNNYPTGAEINQINKQTFLREAKEGLSKAAATYKE